MDEERLPPSPQDTYVVVLNGDPAHVSVSAQSSSDSLDLATALEDRTLSITGLSQAGEWNELMLVRNEGDSALQVTIERGVVIGTAEHMPFEDEVQELLSLDQMLIWEYQSHGPILQVMSQGGATMQIGRDVEVTSWSLVGHRDDLLMLLGVQALEPDVGPLSVVRDLDRALGYAHPPGRVSIGVAPADFAAVCVAYGNSGTNPPPPPHFELPGAAPPATSRGCELSDVCVGPDGEMAATVDCGAMSIGFTSSGEWSIGAKAGPAKVTLTLGGG